MATGVIARPQQPPTRCKDLDDISYTNWVKVYFISNFVTMARGVGRGGICLKAFNSPTPKTPGAYISVMFPIQVKLWPILSQISLPWQPGSVFLKFLWRHSIAWPRKPPVRRKDLGDIFYTSWVIAIFVSNFVAMATGISRDRICVTSFNSPTPYYAQTSRWYFPYKLSYGPFCPKFRCHGNQGLSL